MRHTDSGDNLQLKQRLLAKIDIGHLKVHLSNEETNRPDRCHAKTCAKRIWSRGEQEDGQDWRTDTNSRGVDSHLQTRLDSHSPLLLLPWQPDRRLGGGGSNEFLLSDRCRRHISATLVHLNHTVLTNQLKGTIHPLLMSPKPLFYSLLMVEVNNERKVQLDRNYLKFCECRGVYWDAIICPNKDTRRCFSK